jgi:hypothetical protein
MPPCSHIGSSESFILFFPLHIGKFLLCLIHLQSKISSSLIAEAEGTGTPETRVALLANTVYFYGSFLDILVDTQTGLNIFVGLVATVDPVVVEFQGTHRDRILSNLTSLERGVAECSLLC